MRAIVLAWLVGLAGCALSSEGLGDSKVEQTYTSSRTPADIAGCISNRLIGNNPVSRLSDDHYVVTRMNGYMIPSVRWDIYKTDTGSRIEYRKSFAPLAGEDKAASCFAQ